MDVFDVIEEFFIKETGRKEVVFYPGDILKMHNGYLKEVGKDVSPERAKDLLFAIHSFFPADRSVFVAGDSNTDW